MNKIKNGSKNAKKGKPIGNSEPIVTEYGIRKISNCNFSRLVVLPKNALLNCGGENLKEVDVKLVRQDGEKFIKLTPVCQTEKGEEKS